MKILCVAHNAMAAAYLRRQVNPKKVKVVSPGGSSGQPV